MGGKLPRLVADFETITDPNDCRVWAWGMDTLECDRWRDGLTIESFVEHASRFKSIIYFHNLKFDGMFIIDFLLKNGYTHSTERKLRAKEFSTLISDMGRMYSMRVQWTAKTYTEFKDSAKKFPGFSVARLAKSFNLPMTKGDIDYHEYRAPGQPMTRAEEDYMRRDVHIVCHALKVTLDAGMDKLTIGSDSMNEYKEIRGKKDYTALFPTLGHSLDDEIRRAYRGGFTFCDPRFSGRKVGGGVVLDVNSLYPYIMYERVLPYGVPVFEPGLPIVSDEFPLSIFSVTFTAQLKRDHIPCIQIKNNVGFTPTEYLTTIDEPTELMVSNVDWALYQEHYDITVIHYGGGWLFRGASGMFNDFIDKWSHIKATTTGGQRELAKLTLNSLYGKFASGTNVTSKNPTLEGDTVKLKRGPDELRAPVYTAMGVFITAWARDLTIRAAQENYDVFAYADTDSLHLLCDEIPNTLNVHPTELGAWKHEYDFTEAFYVRAKAYFELKDDGEYENHVAGVPTAITQKMTFDDVYDGNVLHGKLTPKHVPGGIVLVDTPYLLKV